MKTNTFKQPFQDSPRDQTGAIILGNTTRGCQHCGQIEVHYSTNGKVAWYHPGTRCCKQAIQQELQWRQNDHQKIINDHKRQQQQLQQLLQTIEHTTGKEKTDLKNEAKKLERSLQQKTNQNTHTLKELTQEIQDLHKQIQNWNQP